MPLTFAAIIPLYNEGTRLKQVLSKVQKIPELTQVICVNDGSTDNTWQELKKNFPGFLLVNCRKNGGKTAAIRRGFQKLKANYVLLMDADLQRFKPWEIRRAITKVKKTQIDMLILRRVTSIPTTKLIRGDLMLSGERIVKRKILKAVLEEPIINFQIEMALNHYCIKQSLKIGWFPISAISTPKMQKRGLIRGLLMEIRMTLDLFRYQGFEYYVWQMFHSLRIPKVT